MNRKKISRMSAPISGIMSFMLTMGAITIPVCAAETNGGNAVYEQSTKSDYSTYINKTEEKDGFKFTISKVEASRNRMFVTSLIECPNKITDDDFNNAIFMLTVKKSTCESNRTQTRLIDDKTFEVTFDVRSFEDFPSIAQLRFDVVIPRYNLNAWVNVEADISKNFNNIIEKDLYMRNDNERTTCSKMKTDILGTSLYFKEDEYNFDDVNYDNEYSDSKILIKCDDKLYEFDDTDYNYNSGNGIEGKYTCSSLTYDILDNAKSVILIPLICNITNKEIQDIYNSEEYNEDDYINTNDNIRYKKKFKFDDGKDGEVTKVERSDDKVIFYISTDSEKKSMLMASGINGWAWNEEDRYNNSEPEKIIYKDPDSDHGYIIQFNNVSKDSNFNMWTDELILGYSSCFEMGNEVTVK